MFNLLESAFGAVPLLFFSPDMDFRAGLHLFLGEK